MVRDLRRLNSRLGELRLSRSARTSTGSTGLSMGRAEIRYLESLIKTTTTISGSNSSPGRRSSCSSTYGGTVVARGLVPQFEYVGIIVTTVTVILLIHRWG